MSFLRIVVVKLLVGLGKLVFRELFEIRKLQRHLSQVFFVKKQSQNCAHWDDIDDSMSSVEGIINWFADSQDRIQPFAGPGHWNDPDMLVIGNFGLSTSQSKIQMSV